MHAQLIVQRFIQTHLSQMHAARRQLLCAAVGAAMAGHVLSLSRLARALMGSGRLKAALKRIDRLMGCARIEHEAQLAGQALLRELCHPGQRLVVAVDWSAVAPAGEYVELRAAVTRLGMGRCLTIYQRVYPLAKLGNARAERALLETLRAWIDAHIEVTILTDAGFRRPWFTDIEELGWSWIGRVRRGVCIGEGDTQAFKMVHWFARATTRATRWFDCTLTARHSWPCDLVLVRRRQVGRKHYARAGHGPTPKARAEARASAQEPWVLAHSRELRSYRAEEIAALYAQRMQIEENFRDTKSVNFGMGLEFSRSRSAQRLHALLLIHTLSAFLLWHIGQLAEAEGVHRRFKATTRSARELSLITLGCLLCQMPSLPLTPHALLALYQRLGLRS
jgi:Transposase DDE domain